MWQPAHPARPRHIVKMKYAAAFPKGGLRWGIPVRAKAIGPRSNSLVG